MTNKITLDDIVLPQASLPVNNHASATFTDYLCQQKNVIIFSPHFDDAVVSCGSLLQCLLKNTTKVSLINFFTAGSDATSNLNVGLVKIGDAHTAYNYFQMRQKEDRKAFFLLGGKHIKNLKCIDAAWRANHGLVLYPSAVVNIDRNPSDIATIHAITNTLTTLQLPPTSLLFVPLAIGRHVDHVIVRDIATTLFTKIIYYSDLPYSLTYEVDKKFILKHSLNYIDWVGQKKWYAKKARAILAYESQNRALFRGQSVQLPYERYYFSKKILLT